MINSKSYGLQNETRQYLRRLYSYGRELNLSDVADIDNFIKGLKQFNLWQNIVCWPMRSQHNIGTSTRLLSLGGLGIYDGTLFNGLTWDSTGINSTGLTQYMATSLPLLRLLTTIASYKVNINPGGNRRIMSNINGGSWFGMTAAAQGGELNGSAGTLGLTFPSVNVIGSQTFDAVSFGPSSIPYRNNAVGSTAALFYPTAGDGNITLFRPSVTFINATVSIMMAANRQLTISELSLLNNLYKTTIGKGLGLP